MLPFPSPYPMSHLSSFFLGVGVNMFRLYFHSLATGQLRDRDDLELLTLLYLIAASSILAPIDILELIR